MLRFVKATAVATFALGAVLLIPAVASADSTPTVQTVQIAGVSPDDMIWGS